MVQKRWLVSHGGWFESMIYAAQIYFSFEEDIKYIFLFKLKTHTSIFIDWITIYILEKHRNYLNRLDIEWLLIIRFITAKYT